MSAEARATFDLNEANRLGAEGRAQAARAQRVQEWKAAATAAIEALPSGAILSADGVIRRLGLPDEGTNRNNVIGALFNGLGRKGVIKHVGYKKSTRVLGRGRTIKTWERT